jgi:hypothetical protein
MGNRSYDNTSREEAPLRKAILIAVAVAAVVLLAAAPAVAEEWIQSNSVPSYLMRCDWYWFDASPSSGNPQWEYWCYAYDSPFGWVRA